LQNLGQFARAASERGNDFKALGVLSDGPQPVAVIHPARRVAGDRRDDSSADDGVGLRGLVNAVSASELAESALAGIREAHFLQSGQENECWTAGGPPFPLESEFPDHRFELGELVVGQVWADRCHQLAGGPYAVIGVAAEDPMRTFEEDGRSHVGVRGSIRSQGFVEEPLGTRVRVCCKPFEERANFFGIGCGQLGQGIGEAREDEVVKVCIRPTIAERIAEVSVGNRTFAGRLGIGGGRHHPQHIGEEPETEVQRLCCCDGADHLGCKMIGAFERPNPAVCIKFKRSGPINEERGHDIQAKVRVPASCSIGRKPEVPRVMVEAPLADALKEDFGQSLAGAQVGETDDPTQPCRVLFGMPVILKDPGEPIGHRLDRCPHQLHGPTLILLPSVQPVGDVSVGIKALEPGGRARVVPESGPQFGPVSGDFGNESGFGTVRVSEPSENS